MDYTPHHVHGMAVDVPGPVFEGRSLGSFQQLVDAPHYPGLSCYTRDAPLLASEQQWFSRVKLPATVARSAPAGGVGLDVGVQSSSIQSCKALVTAMDTAPTMISADPAAFTGDHVPHWMQVYFGILLQDQFYDDSLPNLISESPAQQPCLYTSDSSASFERDHRNVPSNFRVAPLSSEELNCNWRKSDMVQGNLTASGAAGFYVEEVHDDDSSSVVPVSEDTVDLNHGHPGSSLVRMQRPPFECSPMGPVSWIAHTTAESERASAMITSVVNHTSTLDQPHPGASASVQENGTPPCKRQRTPYVLETMPTSRSQSLIPSLSGNGARTSYSPITSLSAADALYRETYNFPSSSQLTGVRNPEAAHMVVSGLEGERDSSSNHDSRAHRKHNATSVEPQSVAARHRRKKISERVRILEKLIPGGSKMDTASMLDEAIDYVKFLQVQLQLLESLGDHNSDLGSFRSPPTLPQGLESVEGGKDGFVSYGPQTSRLCPTLSGRATPSPFILSEILQQQLFKQKLCLVSLRQCPLQCSPSAPRA